MISSYLSKVEELYSDNIKSMGPSSKAIGWNTDECKDLRYSKFLPMFSETSFTLNDYGCGYAGILNYLLEQNFSVEKFNGYDLSKPMLEEARQNLSNLKVPFELIAEKDIVTSADYSIVSGTFNVKFEATKADWEQYIKSVLEQLSINSSAGFGFNLLSSYVDWEEDHLYYGDPCFWFDYCKRNFSKKVLLIHDYPLYEWTIIVKK